MVTVTIKSKGASGKYRTYTRGDTHRDAPRQSSGTIGRRGGTYTDGGRTVIITEGTISGGAPQAITSVQGVPAREAAPGVLVTDTGELISYQQSRRESPAVAGGYSRESYAALSAGERRELDTFYEKNPAQDVGVKSSHLIISRRGEAGEAIRATTPKQMSKVILAREEEIQREEALRKKIGIQKQNIYLVREKVIDNVKSSSGSQYNNNPIYSSSNRLANYEKEIQTQKAREERFINNTGLLRIKSFSNYVTGGTPYEQRGFFGKYSENLVYGFMAAPIQIGGALSSAGEKTYLTVKAITIPETRSNVFPELVRSAKQTPKELFKQIDIRTPEGAAGATQVATFAALKAFGDISAGRSGFGSENYKLRTAEFKVPTEKPIAVIEKGIDYKYQFTPTPEAKPLAKINIKLIHDNRPPIAKFNVRFAPNKPQTPIARLNFNIGNPEYLSINQLNSELALRKPIATINTQLPKILSVKFNEPNYVSIERLNSELALRKPIARFNIRFSPNKEQTPIYTFKINNQRYFSVGQLNSELALRKPIAKFNVRFAPNKPQTPIARLNFNIGNPEYLSINQLNSELALRKPIATINTQLPKILSVKFNEPNYVSIERLNSELALRKPIARFNIKGIQKVPYTKIGYVKEGVLYRGFSFERDRTKAQPLVGYSSDGLQFGTPKVRLNILSSKEGVAFETATQATILERNLPTTSKTTVNFGGNKYPAASSELLSEYRKLQRTTETQKSAFITKKIIKETRAINEPGVSEVIKFIKSQKGAYSYGSFSAQQQFPKDIFLRRGKAGDIDVQTLALTNKELSKPIEKLVSNLKNTGNIARVSKESETLVETMPEGTKQFVHAVDIHTRETAAQDALSPNFQANRFLGFNLNQKLINIQGSKFQVLSEQGVRKATSIFTLRKSESGELYFAPEGHRVKDVADFFYTQEALLRSKGLSIEESNARLETLKSFYPKKTLNIRSTELKTSSPNKSISSPKLFSYSSNIKNSFSKNVDEYKISKSISKSISKRSFSYSISSDSVSSSKSLSKSISPSVSPSRSVSPSISPSVSPSVSPSHSVSPSISPSISPSVSPSRSTSPSRISENKVFILPPISLIEIPKAKKSITKKPKSFFRENRYTPSVYAITGKITGKPKFASTFTGLGVRPILKSKRIGVSV